MCKKAAPICFFVYVYVVSKKSNRLSIGKYSNSPSLHHEFACSRLKDLCFIMKKGPKGEREKGKMHEQRRRGAMKRRNKRYKLGGSNKKHKQEEQQSPPTEGD